MLIVLKLFQINLKKLKLNKKSLKEKLSNVNKLNLWRVLKNMLNFYKLNLKNFMSWFIKQLMKYMVRLTRMLILLLNFLLGIIKLQKINKLKNFLLNKDQSNKYQNLLLQYKLLIMLWIRCYSVQRILKHLTLINLIKNFYK